MNIFTIVHVCVWQSYRSTAAVSHELFWTQPPITKMLRSRTATAAATLGNDIGRTVTHTFAFASYRSTDDNGVSSCRPPIAYEQSLASTNANKQRPIDIDSVAFQRESLKSYLQMEYIRNKSTKQYKHLLLFYAVSSKCLLSCRYLTTCVENGVPKEHGRMSTPLIQH